MNKAHASIQDKKKRLKRYKTNEQLYLSQLESDLDIALKRKCFYALAVDIINELALEGHREPKGRICPRFFS